MNNKASGPIFLLIIILVIIVASSIAVLANTPSGNYKIIVAGSVDRSITGTWSISAYLKDQSEDTMLTMLGWLPDIHWPWETDRITVQCNMKDTQSSAEYKGSCDAGRVGSWFGGSTNYNLIIRNVPTGNYRVTVKVFEGDNLRIDKNIGNWMI